MNNNRIQTILKEPGKSPRLFTVKNDLAEFQKLVGGYIEVIRFGEGCLCIVNEEGKINGTSRANFWYKDDIIFGTAIFVGSDEEEGDFVSLQHKDIQRILTQFGGAC